MPAYSVVWDDVVNDVSYIQLIGVGVEFSCILADSVPAGSVHF